MNSEKSDADLVKEVSKCFSNEFINRVDEIVCFDSLEDESVKKIVNNYLCKYKSKFSFEFDEENICSELLKEDDLKKYGARYIKRELKKKLLSFLESKIEVY